MEEEGKSKTDKNFFHSLPHITEKENCDEKYVRQGATEQTWIAEASILLAGTLPKTIYCSPSAPERDSKADMKQT